MVAADAHLPDAARSGLFQRQAEHLGGIAVLPLGGTDAVADVPAVGEQIVVQVMAQVGHAHKAFVLVQRQIFGSRNKPGGRRAGVGQFPNLGQPGVEIVELVQCRGAVHPGAEGEKFLPISHDLFAVALVRLPQVDLLRRGAAGGRAEVWGFHQAVAVAVKIEHPGAPQREPAAGFALRVELDELELVAGEIGDEGDEVALLHGVVQGNEKFIFHPFNGQLVLLVGIIGLRDIQRGQRDAAAAHHGLTGGVEHVPAEGADIELGTQQIGGPVSVDHRFALHQFQHRHAQCSGQRFQQGDVGQALGGLPFGDRFGADQELAGKLCLRQAFGFPQQPDGASGHIGIHNGFLLFVCVADRIA